MREMKDSGVAWIGKIPKEWDTTKLLYCLRHPICDGPHETPELVSNGIPFISVDSLNDSKEVDLSIAKKQISEELYLEYSKKAKLEEGDILFSKAATIGKTAIVGKEKFMIWSPLAIIKVDISNHSNNYFYYLLNCIELIKYISLIGNYNTQINVGMRGLERALIPVPALEDQQKIAAHLDRKCTQIDALISNAQQQIEKLKAYKQSVITETVTKGLDPDMEMKNSGVEWIGEIPEHWTVAPIRSLFKIKKDIIGHEPDTVLSITQGGIKVKDINENSGQMANSYAHYQIVNIGDFAMNHMDLLTGGVGISEFEGVTSPDYRVFVMRNAKMNPRYFLYVFQMYYRNKIFYAFGQGAANLGRWRLPAQNFNTVAVPLSPVEEQNNIVTFLDKKCSQIDKLIALKQQKIEKLQQYKKSLIYEYVTGKKEITA